MSATSVPPVRVRAAFADALIATLIDKLEAYIARENVRLARQFQERPKRKRRKN